MDLNKPITNEDIPEPSRNTLGMGKCEIYGCPRWGTIKTDGSWNCSYHWRRSGKNLAHITMLLNNHETEINWYEQILLGTAEVEYVCGDLKGRAPEILRPLQGEGFYAYRKRVIEYVADLLKMKEIPLREPAKIYRKMLAAGDSFSNLSDSLPEF